MSKKLNKFLFYFFILILFIAVVSFFTNFAFCEGSSSIKPETTHADKACLGGFIGLVIFTILGAFLK